VDEEVDVWWAIIDPFFTGIFKESGKGVHDFVSLADGSVVFSVPSDLPFLH
jgi:hypothetical protein